MIKFIDGPAAGVTLELQRAPLFLRVVQDVSCEWDALDQIDDKPEPDETVTVYRLHGNSGWVHYDGTRNGKRFSKTVMTGEYVLHSEQPSIEVARDTKLWQQWASEQAKNRTTTEDA